MGNLSAILFTSEQQKVVKNFFASVPVLILLASTAACSPQGNNAATETPAEATPAEATPAEAPAAQTPGTGTAPVAANGVAGPWRGTLNKGGTAVENHEVVVMTDRDGAPQVGFWEFCNVNMTGEGPSYTVAPASSCFVDLGTGSNTPNNISSGSATFTETSIEATITFENGTVWSFSGTR